MRSIIPFILSVVMLLGYQNCGRPIDHRPMEPQGTVVTDPTFTPYIQEFEYYYGASTSHVAMAFDDLGEKTAGICYRLIVGGQNIYAYVKIDRGYWPKMSELQRRNLIIHELGHCVLNRPHVESNSVLQCPTSFMHDTIMYDYCLQKHFDEYLKEMFP